MNRDIKLLARVAGVDERTILRIADQLVEALESDATYIKDEDSN